MITPNKRKLVWITWRDAVSDSTRTHIDELSKIRLSINTNLGWVIEEDQDRIVLAHGYDDADWIDHFAIPVGDIISIEPACYTPRKKHKDVKK